jgi:hypothetical protein
MYGVSQLEERREVEEEDGSGGGGWGDKRKRVFANANVCHGPTRRGFVNNSVCFFIV